MHLDVALARADSQALLKEFAEGEGDVALGRVGVGRTGVLGDVQTGDAEAAGGADDGDEALEDDVGLLSVAVGSNGLVADGVDAAVDLFAAK